MYMNTSYKTQDSTALVVCHQLRENWGRPIRPPSQNNNIVYIVDSQKTFNKTNYVHIFNINEEKLFNG